MYPSFWVPWFQMRKDCHWNWYSSIGNASFLFHCFYVFFVWFLVFSGLIMMYFCMDLFGFILFRIFSASWIYNLCLLPNLSHYLFKNYFSPSFLLLPKDFNDTNIPEPVKNKISGYFLSVVQSSVDLFSSSLMLSLFSSFSCSTHPFSFISVIILFYDFHLILFCNFFFSLVSSVLILKAILWWLLQNLCQIVLSDSSQY